MAEALPPVSELPGRRVYPGDPLCTIEEFIPGEGVYVDDEGIVRAARIGVVELDMVSRRIRVRPFTSKPRLPRRGGVVYAYILGIPRDDLALVKIFADERMVPYTGTFSAVLHISQASDTIVKDMYEVVRPGDIVRATVLSDGAPYVLSTKKPQDGVILAYCSVCGAPLYREPGKPVLTCLRCGHVEKRKISPHYMLVARRKGRSR